MPFHFGPAGDLFAGAFGVAAAVLLIGGAFLLRWQRNRQQFVLAKTALDAGVTRFASGPPTWLMSMRQGLTTLTLGVSLLVLGGMAYGLTRNAPLPPVTVTQVITTQAQQHRPCRHLHRRQPGERLVATVLLLLRLDIIRLRRPTQPWNSGIGCRRLTRSGWRAWLPDLC